MKERINESYYKEHAVITEPDVEFFDPRQKPFSVYGLYRPEQGGAFKRLPDDVAKATSDEVAMLYTNPSGGRIRFVTDSDYLALDVTMELITQRSILSLACSAGFDVYRDARYATTIWPPIDMENGYQRLVRMRGGLKEITLYFPLYNNVDDLKIGLKKGSVLKESQVNYHPKKPVLFYGSSITQGANASRPGMAYPAMIERMLGCDFINLGFAGSAKGEPAIADYMAELDIGAFVLDYDHNAPTAEHLAVTHQAIYEKMRKSHPFIPILFVTRPTPFAACGDNIDRRNAVFQNYLSGIKQDDRNLYFVDGFSLLGNDFAEDCFADGVHPNDLGFYRMANAIGKMLKTALENRVK